MRKRLLGEHPTRRKIIVSAISALAVAAIAGALVTTHRDPFEADSAPAPAVPTVPVVAGSVASFQCRAVNRYYGGDHVIFLGAVEAYTYNRQEPLLFAHGAFGKFTAGDGK